MKQIWAAPERNKRPILEVLRRVLPESGTLLEISSGTGQHAAYFARELARIAVCPSDVDPSNLSSIAAFVEEEGLPNLRAPRRIDVLEEDWGVGRVDAIFNANLIHIAPWECAEGLIRGAARHLRPEGVFVLYGPFKLEGAHTAESNAAFDADLRSRDARFGVRDAETVIERAAQAGLSFVERVAMPANNQTLVFRSAGP
jgi:SAM-dependent methyltransferase